MTTQQELIKESMKCAKRAGLHYTQRTARGISRARRGKTFIFFNSKGHQIKDEKILARIRKLAVPPAYENVWIAEDPLAHLQVVGEDARGRKQYRYHAKWLEVKGSTKYDRVLEFADVLPKVRRVTSNHLRKPELTREKVLATVVQLLEKTLIRVGNDEYMKQNHSYGLSTMNHEHVKVEKNKIVFSFNGKSKIHHEIILKDQRLAKVVKECREVKGKELFRYHGDDGVHHRIHAQDVNQYLKTITGSHFTAKDFRTWGATVYAALIFRDAKREETKTRLNRVINESIDKVAEKLGNTRSICKKSYIHPAVIDAFVSNQSILKPGARNHEEQVIHFLRKLKSHKKSPAL